MALHNLKYLRLHYSLKAEAKRCVFSFFLKTSKLFMFLTFIGSRFHSRGPATEKALSPNIELHVFGTKKEGELEDDLRQYPEKSLALK